MRREIHYRLFTLSIGSHLTDFLRSRGYCIGWMGLTTFDLVEYGWVDLDPLPWV